MGNDTLQGGNGNDVIDGGDGNDFLDGGAGADTMDGGRGNDTYVVDNTLDTVIENVYNSSGFLVSDGLDTVRSSINYTLGDFVENLTLTGISHLTGSGNSLANGIGGNAGSNMLYGLDGNDVIHAGFGNDSLFGGNGRDYLNGDYQNDLIYGGSGNDTLLGGDGDDTLLGATPYGRTPSYEVDVLVGGNGYDRFVLGASNLSNRFIEGGGDRVFYDEVYDDHAGDTSYAIINDFSLRATSVSYNGVSNISGVGIYRNGLIAVVQHVSLGQLNLSSSQFVYV
jgi:Ca2+-binding RTX toxin-like protein